MTMQEKCYAQIYISMYIMFYKISIGIIQVPLYHCTIMFHSCHLTYTIWQNQIKIMNILN